MDERIRAWAEREAGGHIIRAERPAMGGSRDLYLLDVMRPDDARLELVLRLESGGTFVGTPISLRREAAAYRALADSAVPTPDLVALSKDGGALLISRLAGTPDFQNLKSEDQEQAYADFVQALAALHNLDAASLALEGFARPKTPEDHARLDLGVWAELCDTYVAEPDPLILYARGWLDAHAPKSVQRTVLVQGDTGPGNFLVKDGRVTGIIDWEFAHVGDPMDDLAWLEYRTGVFAADIDPTPHLDAYAEATGLRVDAYGVDYYRVAVHYRCAVTTSLAVARGGGTRGFAPYVLQTQRYLETLGEALSVVMGLGEPPTALPALSDTPRSPWYDRIREGVREVVRQVEDVELRERTRNLQILLHYLHAFDAGGREFAALDAEDRSASIGLAGGASALRTHALEAGARGDEPTLRYLLRRQRREAALWGRLMERVHR